MNYKVSVNYCEDYDIKEVSNCIEKCIASLGGLSNFIKPKTKVMLKCSLSGKYEPNEAKSTHPTLVSVIAEKICKLGATCVIVDSAESCKSNAIDKIYEITEMLNVSNEGNAELNTNLNVFKVDVDGVMTKQLTLLDVINECDVIINMPKLVVDENGVHSCVENLFGLIPSEMKKIVKNRLFNADDYNNYLLDVYDYIKNKLVLTIVDAVVVQEVNGQRIMNAILMGDNNFSVDYICYQLSNVNPKDSSLFKILEKRNLFTEGDEVKVLGTSVDTLIKEDFAKPVREYQDFSNHAQKAKYNAYQKRPNINRKECKGCQRCIWSCPVNAIYETRDKNNEICAKINYSKCINCLKCVKSCPYTAIDTKIPVKYSRLNNKLEKRIKE